MSNEYTPETEDVRYTYGDARCAHPYDPAHANGGCPQEVEFDRWLAQERAEAQVEALREVRRAVSEEQSAAFHDGIRRVEFMLGVTEVLTALDYRADRIAREAGIETGESDE